MKKFLNKQTDLCRIANKKALNGSNRKTIHLHTIFPNNKGARILS